MKLFFENKNTKIAFAFFRFKIKNKTLFLKCPLLKFVESIFVFLIKTFKMLFVFVTCKDLL